MNKALVVAVAGLAAACSGPGGIGLGGRADGSLVASQPCGALYTAALMSVPDVGYRVTSSDRSGGLIIASQDIALGGGSSVGMTVQTMAKGGRCLLTITVSAPPMGLSLTPLDMTVQSYLDAVRGHSRVIKAASFEYIPQPWGSSHLLLG